MVDFEEDEVSLSVMCDTCHLMNLQVLKVEKNWIFLFIAILKGKNLQFFVLSVLYSRI